MILKFSLLHYYVFIVFKVFYNYSFSLLRSVIGNSMLDHVIGEKICPIRGAIPNDADKTCLARRC